MQSGNRGLCFFHSLNNVWLILFNLFERAGLIDNLIGTSADRIQKKKLVVFLLQAMIPLFRTKLLKLGIHGLLRILSDLLKGSK